MCELIYTTVLKLKDEVVYDRVDDDMILFLPEKNRILNLNSTASRICELLKNRTTFERLVSDFYECLIEEDRPLRIDVESDIRKLLRSLIDNGFVEID